MEQYPYEMDVDPMMLSQDFDNRIDILPVSDPNATSFAQRMMQQCDSPELLHRQWLARVVSAGPKERSL